MFHGSKALPRRGFRVVSYDARGHGESGPAPEGSGYGYPALTADLGRVLDAKAKAQGEGRPVLVGHSMGCHTAAAYALDNAAALAGVVLIGPVSLGLPPPEEALAHWDRLSAGLEAAGVDGFMEAYEADLTVDGDWRDTVTRITRERISLHRDPGALAAALRELPRSLPFEGIAELESMRCPALVVASSDEADPGHPYEVAAAWSDAIPAARLVVEGEGESPLAWQGGKLSREVAEFCENLSLGT